MGRPSKYTPEVLRQATLLATKGLTDEELAALFGVNVDSIYEWKKVHPEFSDALKAGKEIADSEVEKSLFQRAMGYSHPDTHISNFQGDITVTPITKHYPPDTTACIFWLKNRQPKQWRDKVDHEHSGDIDIKLTIGGDAIPNE